MAFCLSGLPVIVAGKPQEAVIYKNQSNKRNIRGTTFCACEGNCRQFLIRAVCFLRAAALALFEAWARRER